MTHNPSDIAPGAFRSLGLLSNPFRIEKPARETDYPGVELVTHAAANRLLTALDAAADDPDSRPVWVEKAGGLPQSYYVGPLAEVLRATGSDEPGMNVLTGYVPLDMMRIGRVRAVLSVIAERVSGVDVDLTIAAWMRVMLASLDAELPEHSAIAASDLAALDAALESGPAATVERYFGPAVAERKGAEDLEILMRISTVRQDALEVDAEDGSGAESAADEAPDDAMSEVFTTPGGPSLSPQSVGEAPATGSDTESQPATSEQEPDDGLPRAADLVAYVVAYTSAHLSPVIARGLRAYRAQGISSMTQELKVTKAPTKTLTALCRFATCRFRKVEILFDRFDVWETVPDDLRSRIIGTFSQLRFALREVAVLALISSTGQTPELEEQFAVATRVMWDMHGLAEVEGMEPAFDIDVAQSWMDAATLAGHARIALDEGPLVRLLPPEGAPLAPAIDLLAAAIDDAAARGVTHVDDAAVQAALSATTNVD